MMSSLKKIAATTATLCALTLAPLAHAGLVTFDIKWANGSGADAAFAELTLDSDLVKASANPPGLIDISSITSLNLTVHGTLTGNGKFTKHDFSQIQFYSAGVVNFKKELMGQHMTVVGAGGSRDMIFGDMTGLAGAFDLIALEETTPTTVRPFTMATDRTVEESDFLTVSSIIARDSVSAVPEPETYAMLLSGLGLLTWRARRTRRNSKA